MRRCDEMSGALRTINVSFSEYLGFKLRLKRPDMLIAGSVLDLGTSWSYTCPEAQPKRF